MLRRCTDTHISRSAAGHRSSASARSRERALHKPGKAVATSGGRTRRGKQILESLTPIAVGDFEPCNKGGEKWAGPLDKLGGVHMVSLPDPMTGERK